MASVSTAIRLLPLPTRDSESSFDIITEIKKTKYCFILCDGVTGCSHKEQLSLAISFVYEHSIIREEYLDLLKWNKLWREFGECNFITP